MKKNIWIVAVFILIVIIASWLLMNKRIEQQINQEGQNVIEDITLSE